MRPTQTNARVRPWPGLATALKALWPVAAIALSAAMAVLFTAAVAAGPSSPLTLALAAAEVLSLVAVALWLLLAS